MVNKNILITSAGKRVRLVQMFKNDIKTLGLNSKVYTVEMNPDMSPAAYVSDGAYRVSRVSEESYIDELLKLSIDLNIGIIVPTIDTELLILAQNKALFANHNINVIVSDFEFVLQCRDKRITNNLFKDFGVEVPVSIDPLKPVFPIFAKPYDGSLSNGIMLLKSKDQLTQDVLKNEKLMFMEYIDNKEYDEYSVDMYYGNDNMLKCLVPRKRIEIRAGEINKGLTCKNEIVDYLKSRMAFMKGVIGCICLQLFFHPITNRIVAIEINPRFGGGYPLSYLSGAKFTEYIIKEYLLSEKLNYSDNWIDNVLMLRYDNEVIVKNGRYVSCDF